MLLGGILISELPAIIKKVRVPRYLKWILIILAFLILGIGIDCEFFAFKRSIGHDWEPSGGKDFLNTGVDIFFCDKNMVKGDTLILNNKQFIIKYCAFGSLWITDLRNSYTAKYVHKMSSKDW